MQFKEYVERMTELLEDHPEAAEFLVISRTINCDYVTHVEGLCHYDDEKLTPKHEAAFNNAVCID